MVCWQGLRNLVEFNTFAVTIINDVAEVLAETFADDTAMTNSDYILRDYKIEMKLVWNEQKWVLEKADI